MHEIVGVIGRLVAGGALGLAEEQTLAAQLALGGFGRIELAEDVELGRGREIEQLLELSHEMDLAPALEDVGAFPRGVGRDAVEIGGPLLELGEVFHGLQRPLRAEEALDVYAPQGGGIDAMPMLVGTDIADGVRGRVRVAVGMTVEAGHALVGQRGCGGLRWR